MPTAAGTGSLTNRGPNTTLLAFQKAMDVAMHMLHLSVEHTKKQELTDLGEAIVKDAVTAQVEYVKAGCALSLRALKVGPNTLCADIEALNVGCLCCSLGEGASSTFSTLASS